jgi:hypothetical protein
MRPTFSYNQLSAHVGARIRTAPVDKMTRDYLRDIAAEHTLGGFFLPTSRPLPAGTFVSCEFSVGERAARQIIRARAVVRWRRRWFGRRGMALDFVEFDGLGARELGAWQAHLFGQSDAEPQSALRRRLQAA